MHKYIGILFLGAICLFATPSTGADRDSALDSLRQSNKTETVDSLLGFIYELAPLKKEVQDRLVQARLPGRKIFFNGSGRPYTTDDHWWNSFDVRYNHPDEGVVHIIVKINYEPSQEGKEWFEACVELQEYTGKYLRHEAEYELQGTITAHELVYTEGSQYTRFDASYKLTLTVSSVAFLQMTSPYVDGDTIEDHTKATKKRSEEWIQFHLGTGDRPPEHMKKW